MIQMMYGMVYGSVHTNRAVVRVPKVAYSLMVLAIAGGPNQSPMFGDGSTTRTNSATASVSK